MTTVSPYRQVLCFLLEDAGIDPDKVRDTPLAITSLGYLTVVDEKQADSTDSIPPAKVRFGRIVTRFNPWKIPRAQVATIVSAYRSMRVSEQAVVA